MDNTQNAFFYQIQPISDNSTVFEELTNQQLFFSYFQVDQKYYLFFYQQKSIDIDRIEPLIHILDELDRKQRKIRSLRGFFRYVLEIMENGQDYQILKTNLQPSFWRKLKTILRQNKKIVLLQFLFGSQDSIAEPETQNHVNEKIEALQNQVNSLQERVLKLENQISRNEVPSLVQDQTTNLKGEGSRTGFLEASNSEEYDSTLRAEKGPYLGGNDRKIHFGVPEGEKVDSNPISAPDGRPKIQPSQTQLANSSLNQTQAENKSNFLTFSQISEEEKIEIIKLGFQLQDQKKISLKKYYESTENYSLFQLKGYSLKFESIRRTKLYQNLKE